MKLIIIFGPMAVGKMTVGQKLEEITGLKLFHNHMTMDLISNFFPIGTPTNSRLKALFRLEILKEIAKSDQKGAIFTYLWKLDKQHADEFISKIIDIFETQGNEVYLVELEANQKERLERNKTSNRLKHKPTMRDTISSEKVLKEWDNNYELNTKPGQSFKYENYIKIDNSSLPPEEVAQKIKDEFDL